MISQVPASHRLTVLLISCVAIWQMGTGSPAWCCSPSPRPMTRDFAEAEAILFAEVVSVSTDRNRETYRASCRVRESARGPFQANDRIATDCGEDTKPGDLVLLIGWEQGLGQIEWDHPTQFTPTAFAYLKSAPAMEDCFGQSVPARDRLPYFLPFLEHADPIVAEDAFMEFQEAPFEEVAAIRHLLSRDRICDWVRNGETAPARWQLYGPLLGLAGNDGDAVLLEQIILQPTTDFRIGLDGIIIGYLLLRGEAGLEVIEHTKLRTRHLLDALAQPLQTETDELVPLPFSETYAAIVAVRFMRDYRDSRIPAKRLQAAMTLLLDKPDVADLALNDLARWKDWSMQDTVFSLHDQQEYQVPATKRAIIRYLLLSAKDYPADTADDLLPERVKTAERYVTEIATQDPVRVAEVQQFLLLQP